VIGAATLVILIDLNILLFEVAFGRQTSGHSWLKDRAVIRAGSDWEQVHGGWQSERWSSPPRFVVPPQRPSLGEGEKTVEEFTTAESQTNLTPSPLRRSSSATLPGGG
jgi:hypothetical protein